MKLFKLLIALIVVLHMVGAIAVMACTIHQPPLRLQVEATAPGASDDAEGPAFIVTPPQRTRAGAGTLAMLLVHTLLIFASGTWLICTAVAQDRAWSRCHTASKRSLVYLQERTQEAGEFVILSHAVEDLEPLRPNELEAGLAEAREQDPTLELREVAGRWILRRPRV